MKRVSSKCGNLLWLRKDLPGFYAYWYICPFRENTSEAKEWHGTRETFDFSFFGIYYFLRCPPRSLLLNACLHIHATIYIYTYIYLPFNTVGIAN